MGIYLVEKLGLSQHLHMEMGLNLYRKMWAIKYKSVYLLMNLDKGVCKYIFVYPCSMFKFYIKRLENTK